MRYALSVFSHLCIIQHHLARPSPLPSQAWGCGTCSSSSWSSPSAAPPAAPSTAGPGACACAPAPPPSCSRCPPAPPLRQSRSALCPLYVRAIPLFVRSMSALSPLYVRQVASTLLALVGVVLFGAFGSVYTTARPRRTRRSHTVPRGPTRSHADPTHVDPTRRPTRRGCPRHTHLREQCW